MKMEIRWKGGWGEGVKKEMERVGEGEQVGIEKNSCLWRDNRDRDREMETRLTKHLHPPSCLHHLLLLIPTFCLIPPPCNYL